MPSRSVVVAHLVVLEPNPLEAEECSACRFAALLTFPVKALTKFGVADFGLVKRCIRCWEMEND